MRILHLVHQYPPEFVGGTELVTETLAGEQVKQGHRVSVFYPSPAARQDVLAGKSSSETGVRVYAAPMAGEESSRTRIFLNTFREPDLSAAFGRVLAETQPDLVHIQHLMGLPASLVRQIRQANVPYVVTLHDYWFPCANAQLLTNYDQTVCAGPRWWVNCGRCTLARAGRDSRLLGPALAPLLAARARLLRPVLAQAAAIIAPTHFVRQTYAELGLPSDKITVIPHGIEPPPEPASPKSSHRPGTLNIAYVGGIAHQKGVQVLVEAVNGLPEEGVTLTVYGNLDSHPDFAARLQALARHPGIRFPGRVARDALWAGLAEADVLAVPSLWYETAALVIQEGFAAGLPVLASDLGALRERVQDGVDGLLLPAGDVAAWRKALRRLRDEPELWSQLRRGIRPVRTLDENVADIMDIYAQVLNPFSG